MLRCADSDAMALARRQELELPRHIAAALGRTAVEAAVRGHYLYAEGEADWSSEVHAARGAKVSIRPDADLPSVSASTHSETELLVSNETTLGAARRLVDTGLRTVALNLPTESRREEGSFPERALKKKCCADRAPFTRRLSATKCTCITDCGRGRIRRTGQSTHRMSRCFVQTMGRNWSGRGC